MANANDGRRIDAAMVSNFDSTQQLQEWKAVFEKLHDLDERPLANEISTRIKSDGYSYLWHKQKSRGACETLLGEIPELAAHMSGVLRTAYLYCPKLLLTAAELFDGIFFLALGPKTVLSMLGQTHTDAPTIIVSGRQSSLEECLVHFTVSTIENVRLQQHVSAAGKSDRIPQQNPNCNDVDPDMLTLRPLRYSILNRELSADYVLCGDTDHYHQFTERMRHATQMHEPRARIIAEAFENLLPCENSDHTNYLFLGERWQEWIDAEREGLVKYEDQTRRKVSNGSGHGLFDATFAVIAKTNVHVVQEWLDSEHPDDNNQKMEFLHVLHQISSDTSRSRAFQIITRMQYCSQGFKGDNAFCLTRQSLINWYQFVYQNSMATYLGAYLIGIDIPENSYQQIVVRTSGSAKQKETAEYVQSSLSFSGEVTARLGEMPYAQFSEFCYRSRDAVKRWRKCKPTDSLTKQRKCAHDISYCIQQESEQRDRTDERMAVVQSLVIAVALALISVLLDNFVFTHGFPVVGIVLVAWIIAIAPNVIDACSWWLSDRTSSKSIVFQNS